MTTPSRFAAGSRRVSYGALLCGLLLPATLSAVPPRHLARAAASPRVPRVVRLELPGDVAIRVADDSTVHVEANAMVRGFTLGSSNAKRRPAYRTELTRVGDTVTVRPAYREPLRATGISLRYERFTHVVQVPRHSTVIVQGAERVSVNGQPFVRCSSRQWALDADNQLDCVAEDTL
jgi:hypothetical protein